MSQPDRRCRSECGVRLKDTLQYRRVEELKGQQAEPSTFGRWWSWRSNAHQPPCSRIVWWDRFSPNLAFVTKTRVLFGSSDFYETASVEPSPSGPGLPGPGQEFVTVQAAPERNLGEDPIMGAHLVGPPIPNRQGSSICANQYAPGSVRAANQTIAFVPIRAPARG